MANLVAASDIREIKLEYPHGHANHAISLAESIFDLFVSCFQVSKYLGTELPRRDQFVPFCSGKRNWKCYGKRLRGYENCHISSCIDGFDHYTTYRLGRRRLEHGNSAWPRVILSHEYNPDSAKTLKTWVETQYDGALICKIFEPKYSFYYPTATTMILITDAELSDFIETRKSDFERRVDDLYDDLQLEGTAL